MGKRSFLLSLVAGATVASLLIGARFIIGKSGSGSNLLSSAASRVWSLVTPTHCLTQSLGLSAVPTAATCSWAQRDAQLEGLRSLAKAGLLAPSTCDMESMDSFFLSPMLALEEQATAGCPATASIAFMQVGTELDKHGATLSWPSSFFPELQLASSLPKFLQKRHPHFPAVATSCNSSGTSSGSRGITSSSASSASSLRQRPVGLAKRKGQLRLLYVEPRPALYRLLKDLFSWSLAPSSSLSVLNVALSDKEAMLTLDDCGDGVLDKDCGVAVQAKQEALLQQAKREKSKAAAATASAASPANAAAEGAIPARKLLSSQEAGAAARAAVAAPAVSLTSSTSKNSSSSSATGGSSALRPSSALSSGKGVTAQQQSQSKGLDPSFLAGSSHPLSELPSLVRVHRRMQVSAERLDDLLQAQGVTRLRFLKIQQEGLDPLVLQGASKSLSQGKIELLSFRYSPGRRAWAAASSSSPSTTSSSSTSSSASAAAIVGASSSSSVLQSLLQRLEGWSYECYLQGPGLLLRLTGGCMSPDMAAELTRTATEGASGGHTVLCVHRGHSLYYLFLEGLTTFMQAPALGKVLAAAGGSSSGGSVLGKPASMPAKAAAGAAAGKPVPAAPAAPAAAAGAGAGAGSAKP